MACAKLPTKPRRKSFEKLVLCALARALLLQQVLPHAFVTLKLDTHEYMTRWTQCCAPPCGLCTRLSGTLHRTDLQYRMQTSYIRVCRHDCVDAALLLVPGSASRTVEAH
jgi:hypothetical protein